MEKYPLNVPTPHSFSYVKRNVPEVTVEQRERALKATHYNEFAFPAGLLYIDMLSDSGTTAMTDVQWSALFLVTNLMVETKAIMFFWILSEIFSKEGVKKIGKKLLT